jgi:vacuolar-type H+-ATPase subunit H
MYQSQDKNQGIRQGGTDWDQIKELLSRELRVVDNGLDPDGVMSFIETFVGSSEQAAQLVERFSTFQKASQAMEKTLAEARQLAGRLKEQAQLEAEAEKQIALEVAKRKIAEILEQVRRSCHASIDETSQLLAETKRKLDEMLIQTSQSCVACIQGANSAYIEAMNTVKEAEQKAFQDAERKAIANAQALQEEMNNKVSAACKDLQALFKRMGTASTKVNLPADSKGYKYVSPPVKPEIQTPQVAEKSREKIIEEEPPRYSEFQTKPAVQKPVAGKEGIEDRLTAEYFDPAASPEAQMPQRYDEGDKGVESGLSAEYGDYQVESTVQASPAYEGLGSGLENHLSDEYGDIAVKPGVPSAQGEQVGGEIESALSVEYGDSQMKSPVQAAPAYQEPLRRAEETVPGEAKLYQGEVAIVLPKGVKPSWLEQLKNKLFTTPGIFLRMESGGDFDQIVVVLSLSRPVALSPLLMELPAVQNVAEKRNGKEPARAGEGMLSYASRPVLMVTLGEEAFN